jgi:hypothetical protein
VLHEVIRAPDVLKTRKPNLCDDGPKFAAGSGDTMGGGAVPRREYFTRDDERCRVWSKVLEEVGETVQEDENFCLLGRCRKFLVAET